MKTPQIEKFVGLLRETAAPKIEGQLFQTMYVSPEGEILEDYPRDMTWGQSQDKGWTLTTGYCALGLLGEHLGIEDLGNYGVAPKEALDWLGIDTSALTTAEEYQAGNFVMQGSPLIDLQFYENGLLVDQWDTTVVGLNDGGLTFSQIADVIDFFGLKESLG